MPIRLNGSTSGFVELSPQAVAGNVEHKLPAAPAGEVLVLGNNGGLVRPGAPVATTSGTAIDFTGIPAWVKRVTLVLNGVSTNGSSSVLIQLGAGSIQTTGYLGSGGDITSASVTATQNATVGFVLGSVGAAGFIRHGSILFTSLGSGNIWVANGQVARSDAPAFQLTAGSVNLTGTLDRLRLTTGSGTDVFDAGSVNILWE